MIAIIQGCGSNIASIQYALNRLNFTSVLTDDPIQIQAASHVILPGVGHAKAAMKILKEKQLDKIICQLTQPVLGICLGMQVLYDYSEEGSTHCLGIIPGKIVKLADIRLPLPHMGWNQIQACKESSLMKNIRQSEYMYFVHSYYAPINEYTIATSHYANHFTAVVNHKNFYGMQFHPERSSNAGEQILMNFLNIHR